MSSRRVRSSASLERSTRLAEEHSLGIVLAGSVKVEGAAEVGRPHDGEPFVIADLLGDRRVVEDTMSAQTPDNGPKRPLA